MRIYFDVSCLNRPSDDQAQPRIRLETEAIRLIFQRIDSEEWAQVSSEMARIEIDAMPDADRRERTRVLLPDSEQIHTLDESILKRATELEALGFDSADAVHVAAAEDSRADVLLSCDDRLCRRAKRFRAKLKVTVANPLSWLQEIENGNDA